MTVYVDELRQYPKTLNAVTQRVGTEWCHMACDGDVSELHLIAERIGMKRAWFQERRGGISHYDLTPSRRAAAVRAGAIPISAVEMVRRCRNADAGRAAAESAPGEQQP